MSEVLGHDCDGRPLRAGDRVVLIAANERWKHQVGKEFTIAGRAMFRCLGDEVILNDGCGCPGRQLRKVDRQPLGDWSEIERETGWRPEKQRELEQA